MFGKKFLLTTFFRIRLILLQDFYLVKLTKNKFFYLEGRSFYKAQQQTNDQLTEHCKIKFMCFNQKLILLNLKVHYFHVLVCNMVNFIRLFLMEKFTCVNIFCAKQILSQDGTIIFRLCK